MDLSYLSERFVNQIKNIAGESADELAYLAATGKIEDFIRDKLAYRVLNEKASFPEIRYVAKNDWPETFGKNTKTRRIDIVAYNEKAEPEFCIELKSANTDTEKSIEHVKRHQKNLEEQINDITLRPCIGIFLGVHPAPENDSAFSEEKDPSIKYHRPATRQKRNELKEGFSNLFKDPPVEIPIGIYKGIPIFLLVACLQPEKRR
jgi:hypothetical protein